MYSNVAVTIEEVSKKIEPLQAMDKDEEGIVGDQPQGLGREELLLVEAQDRCE
jgi:hypothetical protein